MLNDQQLYNCVYNKSPSGYTAVREYINTKLLPIDNVADSVYHRISSTIRSAMLSCNNDCVFSKLLYEFSVGYQQLYHVQTL